MRDTSTRTKARIAALVAAAAAVAALAVVASRTHAPRVARSAEGKEAPAAVPVASETPIDERAHAIEPAEDDPFATTTTTGIALGPEVVARLDGIERAIAARDLGALPALADSDIAAEPDAAPSIIHAVATLGAQGGPREQLLAGKTLARWLREEAQRPTRDASGNVVNIIEALGDLGGDKAVTALIDALDRDGMLDLPTQTTAVQRLGALGDARALPAIERFAARVAKLRPADDDFERELQNEAKTAAAEASALLQR